MTNQTEANRNYLASYDNESDQDYKNDIVSVMQRITTALGLSWSCTDYDPADYEKRVVNAIESKDQELRRLREVLETVSSDAKVQIEGRDAVLRGSAETFKELSNKILTLEENLTRSESDRLAELTNIMRMVQALEDTPQDKRNGAIYLIKRVIYEQICRLDPSRSLEL